MLDWLTVLPRCSIDVWCCTGSVSPKEVAGLFALLLPILSAGHLLGFFEDGYSHSMTLLGS